LAAGGSSEDDEARRRRAFHLLYETHERAVLAFALRRTTTSADAEDVAAETFIVAWRRFDQLPATGAPLPWLYGVARKLLANQRRGADRRQRLDARIAEQPQSEQRVIAGTATSSALAALERLRPDDQELLKFVAWEDLSHAEIGWILGITANAVSIRLHRARHRYEQELHGRPDGDDMKGSVASRTFASVRGRMFGSQGRNEAK
jgi:RNA polymerase sigma-70 factor (ECF subfamily)